MKRPGDKILILSIIIIIVPRYLFLDKILDKFNIFLK
jgi:hypothetical protein